MQLKLVMVITVAVLTQIVPLLSSAASARLSLRDYAGAHQPSGLENSDRGSAGPAGPGVNPGQH